MKLRLFCAGLLLALSAPAWAQQSVSVEFRNGQVNLRAQNAPVRAILAEWARSGGATIVNGERVAGPPLTLELTEVPEHQALDIVLRSVAGYMVAPRRTQSTGASNFDRIFILPTSAAPRPTPPANAAAGTPRPFAPAARVQPQPPAIVGPADDLNPEPDGPGVDENAPAPRPVPPRIIRPAIPPGGEREPVVIESDDEPQQNVPAVAPTPGNPFGVPIGSGRPGVITPPSPPQPEQPQP
jgi:hypothetical protein